MNAAVGEESVDKYTNKLISAFVDLQDEYIEWPTTREKELSDCVGYIGGTYIPSDIRPTYRRHVRQYIDYIHQGADRGYQICKW